MKLNQIIATLLILFVAFACEKADKAAKKKEELAELKSQQHELKEEITKLEEEISKLDPEFAKQNRKATLVTTVPVTSGKFTHMVEVSGSVKSKKNVILSTQSVGAILSVNVIEGDFVKAGQLIARQDNQILQKQLAQLETQHELAAEVFRKQANLWEKQIGTEIQYLEAKNNKESLEQQIANVKAQISKTYVKAPFNGTIENVFVNEGEMAMGGTRIAQIVNHSGLYVSADVSESYVNSFKKGDSVIIEFPAINETIKSRISAIGQVIDLQNRTFSVEVQLPKIDFKVKPNLIAVLKIKDFEENNTSIVPTNLIQQDMSGEYVFITENSGEQVVAKKAHIKSGMTYKNNTMIISGLKGGEDLIKDGFKEVIDGTPLKIVDSVL